MKNRLLVVLLGLFSISITNGYAQGSHPSNPDKKIVHDAEYYILEAQNGDTHGRRDYVFIYQGPDLAATVKGNYKRHWISSDPGAKSGIGAATYFLPLDPREKTPMLTNLLHTSETFNRMRARHEWWKKKYPDKSMARAPAFTGIPNVGADTRALWKPPLDPKALPFDPMQYLKYKTPWDGLDPDYGQ